MARIKTRKNFRDMKQYKMQVVKPKKGKGSYNKNALLTKFLRQVLSGKECD